MPENRYQHASIALASKTKNFFSYLKNLKIKSNLFELVQEEEKLLILHQL